MLIRSKAGVNLERVADELLSAHAAMHSRSVHNQLRKEP
jgi:hypothetical protein